MGRGIRAYHGGIELSHGIRVVAIALPVAVALLYEFHQPLA